MAYDVLRQGRNAGAVFNTANEVAVEYFLAGKHRLHGHLFRGRPHAGRVRSSSPLNSLDDVLETIALTRKKTMRTYRKRGNEMNIIYQFLTFLVVLGIIVLVHELGHYIAARLMKIRVEVFSFGFGKRLFGKKDRRHRFPRQPGPGRRLRAHGRRGGIRSRAPAPDQFMAKNRAQKIFTLLMGPMMNLVLALLLIIIVNMGGVEIDSYKLEKPVIGYIEKGSPAEKAGLLPGDMLLAINGKQTPTWKEVEITIGTNPKENLKIDFPARRQPP